MSRYHHGGGVYQAAAELKRPVAELLDFSASINPLGMPDSVRSAAITALDAAIHYPEIHAESLVSALAGHHHLPPGHILAGNGSTPLFALLARVLRPRRALVVRPAFSEYQRALLQVGTEIDSFDLNPQNNFALDLDDLLRRVTIETDLLLIANPGNPSGAKIEATHLLALAQRLPKRVILAIDEAFIDFCPESSILPAVPSHENLYVFRSMTKFYAIPGLRVGYLAGPQTGIARLQEAAEPWALSTIAIAAAKAALAATSYADETLKLLPELRHEFAASLRTLGLQVFPSSANYLLLRLEKAHADAIVAALRTEGILLRSCSNFPPLDAHFLRVAVRSPSDNQRLLIAFTRHLPQE